MTSPDGPNALACACRSIRPMIAVTGLRVPEYGMNEFEPRDPDEKWLWFGEASDDLATVKE